MRTIIVYRRDLAGWLALNKYKLISTEPNPKNPRLNAYRFKLTKGIKKSMQEFLERDGKKATNETKE